MATSRRKTAKKNTGGRGSKPQFGRDEHGCLRDKFNRTHVVACMMHQRYTPEYCPAECTWKGVGNA